MAGVTTAEFAVKMAALAVSTSACSTHCTTYDGTTYDASSGWGSTAACSACLATVYDRLTNVQREATYYTAMQVVYDDSPLLCLVRDKKKLFVPFLFLLCY